MSCHRTKCGTRYAHGMPMRCPKCGGNTFRTSALSTNYSSTVTITGSTLSAYDVVVNIRNTLISEAKSDKQRAQFVEPIIKQLDVAAEVAKEQGSALLSTRKMDLEEYTKKIEEYQGLLGKHAGEDDFQKFFEENPVFLEPKVKDCLPQKSFGGERFPDFVLILHDSSYLIVELEKPSVSLFNKNGDPTSEFTHAQQQVREYLRWAIEEKEFLRRRGCSNITVDNLKGLLVIGKSADLKPNWGSKLENINAEVRGRYEIKTFDGILEENKAILSNFINMT